MWVIKKLRFFLVLAGKKSLSFFATRVVMYIYIRKSQTYIIYKNNKQIVLKDLNLILLLYTTIKYPLDTPLTLSISNGKVLKISIKRAKRVDYFQHKHKSYIG